ncbi:hypothetical protein TRIUR3_15141 [Triticum urartu]|uniref:Uncharacterized protein n=1 Tax=Triticum urartu TaxID=4572 RepID=M7ZH86_TRIUA|nr:hypothetical protein TRIUR3_15141 [Triticum urartu]
MSNPTPKTPAGSSAGTGRYLRNHREVLIPEKFDGPKSTQFSLALFMKVSRSEEGEVTDWCAHNPKNTNAGGYHKTVNNGGSARALNNVTKGDYTCGLKIVSKSGFLHRIKNNVNNGKSVRDLKNFNNCKSVCNLKNVNNDKSVRNLKNVNNGKFVHGLKNVSGISDGGSFCNLKNVNKSRSVCCDLKSVNRSNGGFKPVDDTAARCADLKNG